MHGKRGNGNDSPRGFEHLDVACQKRVETAATGPVALQFAGRRTVSCEKAQTGQAKQAQRLVFVLRCVTTNRVRLRQRGSRYRRFAAVPRKKTCMNLPNLPNLIHGFFGNVGESDMKYGQ